MATLGDLGLSSIANILGAIKYAKYMALGPNNAIVTVATDGAEMYGTELIRTESDLGRSDPLATTTDHTLELDRLGHERIFDLGYHTWVEQKVVALSDFDGRHHEAYWDGLMGLVPVWDGMIDAFSG